MSTVTDYREIFMPSGVLTPRDFCPVCAGAGIAKTTLDRYGYVAHVRDCCRCGLSWIYLRLHATEYADFYQSGAYRRLVSAYHGREMGGCESSYGHEISRFLNQRKGSGSAITLLDIGGAPGGIFTDWGFKTITIIDPAIDGQTAETFDPAGQQWDLITVCQTVDHLLEPGMVFKKLAGCLAPNGVLFFDAVDFDATKEYKIDHPCNFNARSAVMLAHVAGLRIDKMERSGNHLRFLCRHW